MADVQFHQATKIYSGTDVAAVDALDLHIEDGEFMVLVGPSGSGKTTALRMLAGLEEVDAGAILIGGKDVTDLAPKRRDVAMVFQNYALYPYLTVAANMAFPLKMAGVKKQAREKRVREVAKMLGLETFLDRKPGQLSGGQRPGVARARLRRRAGARRGSGGARRGRVRLLQRRAERRDDEARGSHRGASRPRAGRAGRAPAAPGRGAPLRRRERRAPRGAEVGVRRAGDGARRPKAGGSRGR